MNDIIKFFSLSILIVTIIMIIISEPVIDKLEASCKEYGMTYVYRDGQNCLDKNNVLHPIYSECPSPYERGLCKIIFIDYKQKMKQSKIFTSTEHEEFERRLKGNKKNYKIWYKVKPKLIELLELFKKIKDIKKLLGGKR